MTREELDTWTITERDLWHILRHAHYTLDRRGVPRVQLEEPDDE